MLASIELCVFSEDIAPSKGGESCHLSLGNEMVADSKRLLEAMGIPLVAALGEEHGKEMLLVYLDRVEPDALLNQGVNAAVCTACPRIALDDQAKYTVPVLTPPEFEVLLGVRKGDYIHECQRRPIKRLCYQYFYQK
jgi:hypothetical protein